MSTNLTISSLGLYCSLRLPWAGPSFWGLGCSSSRDFCFFSYPGFDFCFGETIFHFTPFGGRALGLAPGETPVADLVPFGSHYTSFLALPPWFKVRFVFSPPCGWKSSRTPGKTAPPNALFIWQSVLCIPLPSRIISCLTPLRPQAFLAVGPV